MVARKSVTTIQAGSVYKERFIFARALPVGATARQEFMDSSGAVVTELIGTVDGNTITFHNAYADVEFVPNGAGFGCYLTDPADDAGEHLMIYGTVFRRQPSFPDSPATVTETVPRSFEDGFQRPAGPPGGRWKTLVGQPYIFDNTEWFGLGEDHPNTVGPNYNFYSRYYMRYYVPFNSDTVTLSISATRKGNGKTIVTLCGNSDATSYLYAAFNGNANTLELGYGTGPDVGVVGGAYAVLQPQITPVALTVPGSSGLATYKMRYDEVTKTLSFYNEDYTVEYGSWEDTGDLVPHGRGYRYFGVGGNSALFNSGVQLAYIRASDAI